MITLIFSPDSKLNLNYALENLLRIKSTTNQPFRFVICSNHSGAMLFEPIILIFCVFDSHHKVLMHNPGLKTFKFCTFDKNQNNAIRPYKQQTFYY